MRAASMRLMLVSAAASGIPASCSACMDEAAQYGASIWETAAETGSSSMFCSMTAACPAVTGSFGRKTRPRSETMPLTMPRRMAEAR